MSWGHCQNPLSLILGVQFFIIIAGSLITGAMLAGWGYPDAPDWRWNPISIVVGNWGWVALLIPITWFAKLVGPSILAGDDPTISSSQIILSVVFTVLLIPFYYWTATAVGSKRMRPLSTPQSENSEQVVEPDAGHAQIRSRDHLVFGGVHGGTGSL